MFGQIRLQKGDYSCYNAPDKISKCNASRTVRTNGITSCIDRSKFNAQLWNFLADTRVDEWHTDIGCYAKKVRERMGFSGNVST